MNEAAPSTFDPDLFQSMQQEAEFSTEVTPIPVDDYNAQISKIGSPRQSTSNDGKVYTAWDISWKIDAPDKGEDAHERTVRQSIFLDLNDAGALDSGKGKNVQLGRLLEALKLNGKPWTPQGLVGNVARISVTQYAGKDKYEGTIFNDVKAVTAL